MTDSFSADPDFAATWNTIAPLLPLDKSATNINGPALLVEKLKRLDDADVVAYIAPTNERFWRKMVLTCYDFAVSATHTFNVGNECDMEPSEGFSDDVKTAIREYEHQFGNGTPFDLLVENLHWWENLGIYFRPSQYGFLNRIQKEGATVEEVWPADEDAYTMFHELAMMKQVFGDMEGELHTFSDGEQPVYPVLLSKMDDTLNGIGAPLLKHCGFTPHYWEGAEHPVSMKWTGFDPARKADDRRSGEIFPMTSKQNLNELHQVVTEWCSDWRQLHVNWEEYMGPTYYIGKCKASTRWIGFVGQRDY